MWLVERAVAILSTPRTEWPVIAGERATSVDLVLNYAAILAAIPALAGFIGRSLIGGYTPVGSGLLRALIGYVATLLLLYVIAAVIDLAAARFGGQKSFASAMKLSVYAHTPVWLAGIFLLVPGLHFLTLLGLYGVYLLWTGLQQLMKVPDYRALPCALTVAGCALIAALVLAVV